jgi:tetratricopeptide (TPR) repeat protein
MRKGFVCFSSFCLFICILLVFFGGFSVQAQEVDPFYVNLLQKAEDSFHAGKYDKAISQLKTCLFGLSTNKELGTKALIYLSLSCYYITETSQSRDYLEQALNLMGQDNLANVDVDERIRGELSGLAAHFKLGEYTPEEAGTVIVDKPNPDTNTSEISGEEGGSNSSAEELESLIEQDPENVGRYYHLYELYLDEGNRNKARRTLQNLIESHPDEIYGLFLLGRMRFRDKKYREAANHFQEALRPRPNITISNELAEELKTYQILSVYSMGDKQRALDIMSVSVHLYTETKIRALPISGTEKATLREIIREYMRR